MKYEDNINMNCVINEITGCWNQGLILLIVFTFFSFKFGAESYHEIIRKLQKEEVMEARDMSSLSFREKLLFIIRPFVILHGR